MNTRLLACLVLLSLAPAARADGLLSVADVQRITGLSGLSLVPKNPALGAGGELNFAGPDKKLVLMVMVQPLSQFVFWKKQYGASALPVPELGPQAFRTRPGEFTSYVVFTKAAKGFWIQSMGWGPNGQARLSGTQLLELARLVSARAK